IRISCDFPLGLIARFSIPKPQSAPSRVVLRYHVSKFFYNLPLYSEPTHFHTSQARSSYNRAFPSGASNLFLFCFTSKTRVRNRSSQNQTHTLETFPNLRTLLSIQHKSSHEQHPNDSHWSLSHEPTRRDSHPSTRLAIQYSDTKISKHPNHQCSSKNVNTNHCRPSHTLHSLVAS
ncbi:hypothetical protein M758_4G102800, partial [Ceratodon purpureus]